MSPATTTPETAARMNTLRFTPFVLVLEEHPDRPGEIRQVWESTNLDCHAVEWEPPLAVVYDIRDYQTLTPAMIRAVKAAADRDEARGQADIAFATPPDTHGRPDGPANNGSPR